MVKGTEMMQRGSSTMARNLLLGSLSVILLLVVLYYMKRVEVGRLKHDMDDMLLQRSDREDELNRKLTEYLQKLEDMTRQLGDINSRLQECEDNKAAMVNEIQKCKSVHSECLSTKEGADSNLKIVQANLDKLKAQQNTANTQLSDNNRNLANVQHSLAGAERELLQCEEERESCTTSLRDSSGLVQECQQREMACQASLKASGNRQAAQQVDGGGGLPAANAGFHMQPQQKGQPNNPFKLHNLSSLNRQQPRQQQPGADNNARPQPPQDAVAKPSPVAKSSPDPEVEPDPLAGDGEEEEGALNVGDPQGAAENGGKDGDDGVNKDDGGIRVIDLNDDKDFEGDGVEGLVANDDDGVGGGNEGGDRVNDVQGAEDEAEQALEDQL